MFRKKDLVSVSLQIEDFREFEPFLVHFRRLFTRLEELTTKTTANLYELVTAIFPNFPYRKKSLSGFECADSKRQRISPLSVSMAIEVLG